VSGASDVVVAALAQAVEVRFYVIVAHARYKIFIKNIIGQCASTTRLPRRGGLKQALVSGEDDASCITLRDFGLFLTLHQSAPLALTLESVLSTDQSI
jgi:hypothetical protein